MAVYIIHARKQVRHMGIVQADSAVIFAALAALLL